LWEKDNFHNLIVDIDKKYLPDINKVASRCVYKKAMKAL
jgi:hypothetical protein